MNIFNSYVLIEIDGKNINNFIKKLIQNKINIYKLNYISFNKINIIVNYNDLNKIKKIKTIYKINIIKYYGKKSIILSFKKNIVLLISLIIGLLTIIFLSNVIFEIEIVHTNKELINKVKEELENNDIKKYNFKKSYKELEKIEEKILNNNKDLIEWIEIDSIGTKYKVNVEQRKLNKKEEKIIYSDIVASKDAMIVSIVNSTGEKIKNNLEYVKKDEVIVSGTLLKPSGEKIYLSAKGKVLGEVWYNINVEHPFTYKEEVLTGKSKTLYSIKFFNKKINLFNYKRFNTFKNDEITILKNNLIPLSLVKEKQYEIKIINEIYTFDEVKLKAINKAKKNLLLNDKIKEIKDIKILKTNEYESKIELELFVKVIEDITKIKKIDPDILQIKD